MADPASEQRVVEGRDAEPTSEREAPDIHERGTSQTDQHARQDDIHAERHAWPLDVLAKAALVASPNGRPFQTERPRRYPSAVRRPSPMAQSMHDVAEPRQGADEPERRQHACRGEPEHRQRRERVMQSR